MIIIQLLHDIATGCPKKKWELLLVIVAVTSSFFGTPCTNWSAKVFVIIKNQIYATIVKYHILNIYEISNIFFESLYFDAFL